MKNKIKIVSVLLTLGFLVSPLVSFAAGPVLPMTLEGTVKWSTTVNMPIGTVLKAYCGNTNTEIGVTTLTVEGQYGPENSSLPVNNCSNANIYVQATSGGTITEKKDTGLTFSSTTITNHSIVFTSGTTQPDTPTVPSSLSAIVDSQTEITLSWVDNSNNETAFKVYKNGGLEATTVANVVTYQVTGLTAATSYIFKVRAANGDQHSAYTSEVTATTLSAAVNADPTTGVVAGNAINSTQAGYVNDSAIETVTKGLKADIISNITIVSNVQTLTSIGSSSAEIIVGKQAIALGTATTATTSSTAFDANVVSTTGVVETTVFVPVNTIASEAQKVAIVIPELTLIKTSAGVNLASVEIRPPVVSNNTTVENAIKLSFAESTAPVSVKASISVPTSVAGITFYAANGTTAQYIDICMDSSAFTTTDPNDILVYYSSDGVSWAIDSPARNKAFVGNQFCFQTNHLSSFAAVQANSKSVACIQSGAPSNASYNVNNVNVTWTGSAWATAANCAWTCNSGYSLSGSVCVAGGTAVIGGGGGGGGDPTPTPAVPMPTTTDGEVTATKAGGGKTTLTTAENTKATVRLPANSVSSNTDVIVVSVAKTSDAVSSAVSAVSTGKKLVGGYVYDISAKKGGVAVSEFSKYATITLTYTTSQIAGLKESSLTINYWDETTEKWVPLSTTVNKTSNTLTAKTMHFTYFAIMGEEGVDAPVTITRAYIREQIRNIIKQLIVLITELITVYQAELIELRASEE